MASIWAPLPAAKSNTSKYFKIFQNIPKSLLVASIWAPLPAARIHLQKVIFQNREMSS